MRAVVDTNVVLSACFFSGRNLAVMLAWENEQFDLCATPEILDEYQGAINWGCYEFDRLPFPWFEAIVQYHCPISPRYSAPFSSRDPGDNIFLDCAVGARADYLVSNDRDLLSVVASVGFKIVTPAQFLAVVRRRGSR